MSRILKAYETRFRWLLQNVGTRQLGRGIEALVNKARGLSRNQHLSLADALTRVYEELAARPAFRPRFSCAQPELFCCDAGLGGLARWLRAVGYDARWEAGIDDDELLQQARTLSGTLLTTDSMLMERRVLRDRIIPAYWLPPTLSIRNQLTMVMREFNLQRREPRCMSCGGELQKADKENLRDRIPPRTYRWLDTYFVCTRCGKLFWHGTHWSRIVQSLSTINQAAA